MFSNRSAHDPRKNRIALALEARAPEFDLTESNPTRTDLPYPTAQLMAAFDNEAQRVYAPDPRGLLEARRAIAALMQQRGTSIDPERITLASGTSEAYGYLFKLLCDPDDEVLVPEPSYPLFADLCRLEQVRARSYPLHYDGQWHLGLAELEAAITERTRAILLVSPNNPTGSYLKREELARLETLGLPLISDEVFADYPLREDEQRVRSALESSRACVFALGGLSKQIGLPQWKVSWLCMRGSDSEMEAARARLDLIADTYLSVATPTQLALPRLLEIGSVVQRAIHQRLQRNLANLRRAIDRDAAVSLLDVEGGFYATLRLPRVQSEEAWVLELLERDGVLVQPGFFFDFAEEAYVVISLLTPEATFERGIARLLARVDVHVGHGGHGSGRGR
ncbi:MAG TPA: pyridoxal phosphate-dependent aminotransferase [Polyangiales bacterium]|nr:pyridoxal phosphate-dependent aminotransferase [Polyangiales bacterium]